MQEQSKNNSFSYTYSAEEQEEIKKIRQKYQPQEESKMDRILRLDAQVTKKATKYSLIIGIVGALIMGTGMSLVMTDLGTALNIGEMMSLVTGIVIGILGIIIVSLAYPVYNHIVKKEREAVAPEILRLTDELMK